jgi:hypothetical protein
LPFSFLFLFARYDLAFLVRRQTALRQKQSPQGTKIIQNAAAAGDMKVQFCKIERNQEECFFAAVGTIFFG